MTAYIATMDKALISEKNERQLAREAAVASRQRSRETERTKLWGSGETYAHTRHAEHPECPPVRHECARWPFSRVPRVGAGAGRLAMERSLKPSALDPVA